MLNKGPQNRSYTTRMEKENRNTNEYLLSTSYQRNELLEPHLNLRLPFVFFRFCFVFSFLCILDWLFFILFASSSFLHRVSNGFTIVSSVSTVLVELPQYDLNLCLHFFLVLPLAFVFKTLCILCGLLLVVFSHKCDYTPFTLRTSYRLFKKELLDII